MRRIGLLGLVFLMCFTLHLKTCNAAPDDYLYETMNPHTGEFDMIVDISSDLTLEGDFIIDGSLSIGIDLTVNRDLYVGRNGYFDNDVDILNDLVVEGYAHIKDTLYVYDGIMGSDAQEDLRIAANQNLPYPDGEIIFHGTALRPNTGGTTNLGTGQYPFGDLWLYNNATVGDVLRVEGNVFFENNLSVDHNLSVNNILYVGSGMEQDAKIIFDYDGEDMEFFWDNSATHARLNKDLSVGGSGRSVFHEPVYINQDGYNQDTIIEGNTVEDLFVVDASADRVGIGTDDPNYLLHVDGTVGCTDDFTCGGEGLYITGNDAAIELKDNESATQKLKASHVNGTSYIDYFGGDLQIRDEGIDVRLYIKNDGKVGVGAVEPDALFDVDGNVSISNNLSVDGNIICEGYIVSRTRRIKLLCSDFKALHAAGNVKPTTIDGPKWYTQYAPYDIIAFVEIPDGYKATAVMVYGEDAVSTVEAYECLITDGTTATSKGSGTVGTEIDITDVDATSTNYLTIGVNQDGSTTDEIFGGYVEIERM